MHFNPSILESVYGSFKPKERIVGGQEAEEGQYPFQVW